METIKNYLDNMFTNLPKTNELIKLYNDLLLNMEEKYKELKNDGKSENEAIGIVISEFGNIDELINELEIDTIEKGSGLPTITLEEANEFMTTKKKSGFLIGIGVVLCILGAATLILFDGIMNNTYLGKRLSEDAQNLPGVISLFVLVVIAVALFIYSGMKLEKYKYLKEPFDLPISLKSNIEQKFKAFSPTYMISTILGVSLCILSPVAILIIDALGNESLENYGVVALLTMIAGAVFIFIYFGNIKKSYSILLKTDNFSKEKTEDKVSEAVTAIIWPLAVIIFLISGLIFNKWHINWIIFPITGILFGMFKAVHKIIKGNK
ncbi:permease prefix domain 1-containing protein [Clostridium taeniosporum]|uniref:Uncharacterized protein n=1 Tax=Clostridium taeniosporum TaxID=394958 RepID=A0A1D7XP76_9CLOT|nr:permease prefix domain 1-containing protein [Clostridium taeniosporum]AOR25133.1 hypothetical protein BGI42_15435 [Clostridium taeniosporum]